MRLPPLGHNQRFKFEQQSRHLLQPVGVLALGIVRSLPVFTIMMILLLLLVALIAHYCNFILGLHDPPPLPDQCRQGGQVSWQEVRGAARGSWPSSQARLASSTGLPTRSPNEVVQGDVPRQIAQPWCSSRRQATLERDSKGERGKKKYPERSQRQTQATNSLILDC